MPQFKIAHLREQGQDIIIVPVESSFGYKTQDDQFAFIDALQTCAETAGLAGTVVPIWREGGASRFIAPTPWHPFFRTLPYDAVLANLNKVLTCN